MTLKQLQEIAKERGIKNVKKYKKAELETMLHSQPVDNTTVRQIISDDLSLLADLDSLEPDVLASHLSRMSKSDARKLRKTLYRSGHRGLAATKAA